jgi:hypothetical protein
MDVVALSESPWSKRNRAVGDSAEAEVATVRGAGLQASRAPCRGGYGFGITQQVSAPSGLVDRILPSF